MLLRSVFYGFLMAAALLVSPLHNAWAKNNDIDIEPPAPIYEVNPGERPGYIWTEGCWTWDGQRHRWHPGYWVAERPGATWVPDNWEKRGKLWHFNKGHWEEDEKPAAQAEPTPVAEAATTESDKTAADASAENSTPATKSSKAKRCKTHCKPASQPNTVNYNDPKIWPFYIHH